MKSLFPFSALSVALALTGCSSQGGDAATSAAPVSSSATPTSSAKPQSSAKAAGDLKIDAEGQKLLKAVIANCEIDTDSPAIKSCKGGELDALSTYAKDKKPANLLETVAESAVTDGAKDPKTLVGSVVALNVLIQQDVAWVKTNSTPAAGERIVKLAATLADNTQYMFETPAARIALGAGMGKELSQALDARKEGDLAPSVYDYFLDTGDAAAFPILEAETKSTNKSIRYASVWAAGVALGGPLGQSHLEPDAKKKVCEWAKGFASNPDAELAGAARESLTRCGGAYIDAALDSAEAALKAGPADYHVAQLPHHTCWAEGLVGGHANGSPEQCKRALDVSKKALENKDLKGENLRVVLFGVYQIGQNAKLEKDAKPILQKYTSDADKMIANEAKGDLKNMK